MGIKLSGKVGMGMRCWTGNGNGMEWDGNGNDCTGVGENGNNNSHPRTPLTASRFAGNKL